MKRIIFLIVTIILLGCNQSHKTSDLVGTWDVVSSTDIENGEISFPDDDDEGYIEFTPDSLFIGEDREAFAWEIKGDSILLKDFGFVYIKEFTLDKLIVEYDFLGETQLKLKKRK